MNPVTIDPFVPVKGQMCPYGGWCHTCLTNLKKDLGISENSTELFSSYLEDYPGSTRGYHGGPNFCESHKEDRVKYDLFVAEQQKLFLESYNK